MERTSVPAMEPGELSHEDFAERIGDTFTVPVGDGGTMTLRLVAARQGPPERHGHSIELAGPADWFMPQGTYLLSHEEWGSLPLFLVPIGELEDGYLYEAVFTRAGD